MPKVVLLVFDTDPDAARLRSQLAEIGATVVEAEPRWPVFFDTVTRERPDVAVISCGAIAQHGREAARYLGDGFNTRNIPVVMVNVEARDLAITAQSAPRARIVGRDQLQAALRHAFAALI